MWQADFDRRPGYTLLTLSKDDDVRGSVVLRSKTEEDLWKRVESLLILEDKDERNRL